METVKLIAHVTEPFWVAFGIFGLPIAMSWAWLAIDRRFFGSSIERDWATRDEEDWANIVGW